MRLRLGHRINQLLKSVLDAFAQEGVYGLEVLTAQVNYHPLDWQAPALKPDEPIGEDFPTLLYNLWIEWPHGLFELYKLVIWQLRNNPAEAIVEDEGRWPFMRVAQEFGWGDESITIFSVPEVYDNKVSEEAVIVFALEFAALMIAGNLGEVHVDTATFMAEYAGHTFGVKDGRLCGVQTVMDCSDYLEAYLAMPRGRYWHTTTLDPIDRMFYWVEANYERALKMGNILDSLTILRSALNAEHLKELEAILISLQPATTKKVAVTFDKLQPSVEKLRRVEACFNVMADWQKNDYQRVMEMLSLLVPTVMAEGTFNVRIWDLNKQVTFFRKRDEKRILNSLTKLSEKLSKEAGKQPKR